MAGEGMLEITVSDPVKQGEGMNAFVSYKINTKTDLPAFEFGQFSVIRRYSDFVWMRAQLVTLFPGVIIPPLPEKMVVGRFTEEFVESRRRLLEKFLNRVAVHESLRGSDHFKMFLEASEEALAQNKKASEKKKSKSWASWARETAHSAQKAMGSVTERELTEEDKEFDEVCAYVNALQPQMVNVHKHTQELIKRNRGMANGLFEFGLAFTLLGQSESDALGSALAQLGHCADKLSVLAAEETEKESIFFEEPIKDYIRIVGAVKQALDVRDARRLTYETCLDDVANKTAARNKLAGQPGKEDKASAAEAALTQAQEKCDEAKADFDKVTKLVLSEVERFKRDKLADFKSIVLDYVQLQIEHNQKVEEAWRAVLPDLEAMSAEAVPKPAPAEPPAAVEEPVGAPGPDDV